VVRFEKEANPQGLKPPDIAGQNVRAEARTHHPEARTLKPEPFKLKPVLFKLIHHGKLFFRRRNAAIVLARH